MLSFIDRLTRKKVIPKEETESSDLSRCLSTFDLVGIGKIFFNFFEVLKAIFVILLNAVHFTCSISFA